MAVQGGGDDIRTGEEDEELNRPITVKDIPDLVRRISSQIAASKPDSDADTLPGRRLVGRQAKCMTAWLADSRFSGRMSIACTHKQSPPWFHSISQVADDSQSSY